MSRINEMTKQQEVRDKVRSGYAEIAQREPGGGGGCCGSGSSGCGPGSGGNPTALAQAIGYGSEELADLPEGANMGLSCGNPVALAGLKAGEVVVDLGSGGGFDVFIAGRKVGPEGRAIGVDMTPEMLSKARRNAVAYRERTGFDNVEFRLGEIEALPLPDSSADVVISNCVINLSPDKKRVWKEIARILKPGGRVAVSDLALKRPLPEEIRESVEALVGCIAGAVLVEETERMAQEAGLMDIELTERNGNVDAMLDTDDPLYAKMARVMPPATTASDYVTSLAMNARKPG